jgi:hypothetical protein
MLTGLVGRVGEDTAAAWLKLVSAPVIMFWGLGALAWMLSHPDSDVVSWLGERSGTEQVVMAAIAVGVLLGSSAVLAELSQPLLRLLEGYWPPALDRLRVRRVTAQIAQRRSHRADWEQLVAARAAQASSGSPAAPPQAQHVALDALAARREARLDLKLHQAPLDESMMMPTSLGNVFRAAETYPDEKYGLNGIIMWSRLWLVMPETTREAVNAARRAVDQSVAVIVALFASLVWLPLTWWMLIPALVGPPLVYKLFLVGRAQVMAELVKAAFDLHRMLVYSSLRFQCPTSPETEVQNGRELTSYVWRGFAPVRFEFTDPAADRGP